MKQYGVQWYGNDIHETDSTGNAHTATSALAQQRHYKNAKAVYREITSWEPLGDPEEAVCSST